MTSRIVIMGVTADQLLLAHICNKKHGGQKSSVLKLENLVTFDRSTSGDF